MCPSSRLSRILLRACALVCALASVPALALDADKAFHHYVRDGWSIEQGLPQISALAIAQDREGYLWVGTQAGLARFDGHRFTPYTPRSTAGLPGGWIHRLLNDSRGRLWIATYKGLALRDEDGFRAIPAAGIETGLNVVALAESPVHGVLAAAGNVVYRVEGELLQPWQRLPAAARSLLAEGETLWVGSVGGVQRIGSDGAAVFLALPAAAAGATVAHLLRAQGTLWAGTSSGLFQLQGDAWVEVADETLRSVPIEGLLQDRDGNLWVAELTHLSRLRDGRLHERIADEAQPLAVRALFEDREGNLWIGSQWAGLIRLRDGWTYRYSIREGLHTPLLWTIADAGAGALWVGSDDGLSLFSGGRFRQLLEGRALPHPHAYTLLAEEGGVWIGTRRGVARYVDGRLHDTPLAAAVGDALVTGLLRDGQGDLWLGSSAGLFRLRGGQVTRFAEAQGLSDPRVRQLLLTTQGRLLLGSQSGLFLLDGERLRPWGIDAGLPAGTDITALHALPEGRLVLGSMSEEMYYFDGQRWHQLGEAQGMPVNAGFHLTDDGSTLWVAGIRGVHRVPLDDLAAFAAGQRPRVRGQMVLNERGDRRGGQKGYCCNGAGNAKGLLRDGLLWAPTRDGLVALQTAAAGQPPPVPTTLIERWRVGEEWRLVAGGDEIVLPSGVRDLGFEFTAISFQDPRSIGFRYRLRGYDADWREPDEAGQRIVAYTNLPSGPYTFEVQGAVADDAWSAPATLRFSIRPAFRETLGFPLLLGTLAALLGLLAWRWQQRRYAQRAAALERLVQQRTEDLAQANLRLQEASLTDPLTTLRNRRYLAQQIPKDLSFYGRELRRRSAEGQVIVFALLDIDHFKRINDEHGHAAGDRVLQQFAALLLAQVRSGDYVARWGGEEFVVVFRPTPQEHVPLLGDRLCRGCASHPFDLGNGRVLAVTCSVGLVEYPLFDDGENSLDWEQLMELADRALYRVKRAGRNGWGAYRPAAGLPMREVIDALKLEDETFRRHPGLRFIGSYGETAS